MDSVLRPRRRGQGTGGSPWRWSGRFHLSDVDGRFRARIGDVPDVEADMWNAAAAAGLEEFNLRILPAGRPERPVPMLSAARAFDTPHIACSIRGGRVWGLSYLLGMVLRDRALVTVEAWAGDEEATADADGSLALAAQAELARYLRTLPLHASFSVRDILQGRTNPLQRRALADAAHRLVGRGQLEMLLRGKRRIYILRRVVHEESTEVAA